VSGFGSRTAAVKYIQDMRAEQRRGSWLDLAAVAAVGTPHCGAPARLAVNSGSFVTLLFRLNLDPSGGCGSC